MDISETVLSTKRIFEGRVINLRVDTVRLPNGREATREVVEHNGAMAAVPLLDDGRIVLVRQNRRAAGGPLLEIPAGSLNKGEDIEACVRRELVEEIQMMPGRIRKMFSMYVAPGYSSEQIHVYLAQGLVPTPGVGDDDEFIIQEIVSLEEALASIDSGEICDAKSIAGILNVSRLRSANEL